MILRAYFEDDLDCNYNKFDEIQRGVIANVSTQEHKNCFRVLWNMGDPMNAVFEGNAIKLPSNSVILIRPLMQFEFQSDHSKIVEYTSLYIHPNLHHARDDDDDDFFRAFIYPAPDELIIRLDPKEDLGIISALRLIVHVLEKSYGRTHLEPRVLSLISELDFRYDKLQRSDEPSSNSLTVKVMTYINTHYTELLTLQKISKRFFVSVSTICRVVKNYTGKSFGDYVTTLRLTDAKMLLNDGRYTAERVCLLCGFGDYSSFYRAYKQAYGIAPKTDKAHKERHWPLS